MLLTMSDNVLSIIITQVNSLRSVKRVACVNKELSCRVKSPLESECARKIRKFWLRARGTMTNKVVAKSFLGLGLSKENIRMIG